VSGRSTRLLGVMRTVPLICLLAVIGGCAEPERCWKNVEPAVDVAFAKYLTSRGVKFKLDPERGVCVSQENATALDDAHRRVTEYGVEVAASASDDCELRDLVDWAKREGLTYQVSASTRSDGARGGNMVIIRSLTPEEVASNRQKLDLELPKVRRCKS
jgi:hypothetical protein